MKAAMKIWTYTSAGKARGSLRLNQGGETFHHKIRETPQLFHAGHADASELEVEAQKVWRELIHYAKTLRRLNVLAARQGTPQLGHKPSFGLDGRAGGGRLAGFGKPLRRLYPKGVGDP